LSVTDTYEWTAEDHAELAEIEADARNVKLRRKRFFAKLRQRRYRMGNKS
jgi:hypothetical protein